MAYIYLRPRYPSTPVPAGRITAIMYKPQTTCEWAFFGTTAVQAAVNTALQLSVCPSGARRALR